MTEFARRNLSSASRVIRTSLRREPTRLSRYASSWPDAINRRTCDGCTAIAVATSSTVRSGSIVRERGTVGHVPLYGLCVATTRQINRSGVIGSTGFAGSMIVNIVFRMYVS